MSSNDLVESTVPAGTEPTSPVRGQPATVRRLDRAALVAVGLVTAGLAYRLFLILAGIPPTNSDESTMAMAAAHIVEGRHYPAFFYGDHYMGTLEAYLAAPLFALFGPSIVVLRLPLLALYAVFCHLMYALTRRLYGRWFAVLVVGLLALGSDPVVRSEIFAGGGYPEIKPAAVGLLLMAVWLGTGDDRHTVRRILGFAGWGLVAGLALWSDVLIAPYVAAAGLVLVLGCRRELLGWPGVLLVLCLLVGTAPAIAHYLQPGVAEASLTKMLTLSGGEDASIWSRIHGGVLLGVPLGTGLCAGSQCTGWPLVLGAAYPLLLLLAGCLAGAALRRTTGAERIRQAGRLALVVGGALTLISYAQSDAAGIYPTTSMRYLCPLLICLPAVLWPAWSAAARLLDDRRTGRSTATSPAHPGGLRLAAGVAGGSLLAVVTLATVGATVAIGDLAPESRQALRTERELTVRLAELGVTRFYSEYWTCNWISFATRERMVCATLGDDLRPGNDRYRPYRDLVTAAPDPAYVLPLGSPLDRAFAGRLQALGVTADVSEVAGYRIYRPHAPVDVPLR
ncbi:hypothetical protein GCM10027290_25290 [Micromonospora sonneratiae]|uniref:ArnT family glycosyltransferase n=1 Tax=Micromonospora sonneratiae TaxID=1184706 RepID=A0ABW3YMQ3_9ACTN